VLSVAEPCTVLIAPPQRLPTPVERTTGSPELLTFSDAEVLRALETIVQRRPQLVVLEKTFAETPRGAALIKRISADPFLAASEVRIVTSGTGGRLESPSWHIGPPPGESAPAAAPETSGAVSAAAPPLDQRGTRRAQRYVIAGEVSVLIDGNPARLVNLSKIGAQVVSPTILKPNQRVRMALVDDGGAVRFNAAIVWAAFEIPPKSGPRYRAGIEFVDADAQSVEAFCVRHV